MPGNDDDALEELAGWPNANLNDLWIDANVLVQILRSEAVRAINGKRVAERFAERFSVRGEWQKTSTAMRYTKTQLQPMIVFACAAGGALADQQCMLIDAANELDADVRTLATLVRAARVRGDDNYIIRRGAILHGDVAMIAPFRRVLEIKPGHVEADRKSVV